MKLKRRHFFLGAVGAVGALVVGWSASPVRQRLVPDEPLLADEAGSPLNGWVRIARDGRVSVVMTHAEMGQGTHTGLAMLLAEELDADWSLIRLEAAGGDGIYNNLAAISESLPFDPDESGLIKRSSQHLASRVLREIKGMDGTGGSSSINDKWLPMRQAGASARAMLVSAASKRWQVPAGECSTAAGRVSHPSGHSASYGELVDEAAVLELPRSISLKKPAEFKLVGQPVRRLEGGSKANGSAVYAIDADPPRTVYAFITMCPILGGAVKSFSGSQAAAMPGVKAVLKLEPVAGGLGGVGMTAGGVAVVATTPYGAWKALTNIEVEWDPGSAQGLSSKAIAAELRAALEGDGEAKHLVRGDVVKVKGAAAKTVRADYSVPFLAHAAMEPLNCTVLFDGERATVWASTQASGLARDAVAKVLEIESKNVELKPVMLGGGFGRRFFTDFIVQAAVLAKRFPGEPVKLMWSREQDMTHDFYRPMFAARCEASLDQSKKVVALQMKTAGSSLGAPSFMDGSVKGSADMPYRVENMQVTHATVENPATMGIWRSVAHSQNAFFLESFIDEIAVAAETDPLELRTALLSGRARHLNVLRRLKELSKWTPLRFGAEDGSQRAKGMALVQCFGSVVGQVAEVSLSSEGDIRVHKVFCVIDCGFAVNPNLIRQQMEGGIVYGLTAALHGEITMEGGRVGQTNFHDYLPLRMSECPDVQTEVISSGDTPWGVGEAGTPAIAPAVANALFALTGKRTRSLPIKL